jgi:hypothetical protein
MPQETAVVFNVGAKELLIGLVVFFVALISLVWKGRKEIGEIVEKETKGIKATADRLVVAVTEMQTVLKSKKSFNFTALLEKGASPLRPTEFGANLIKNSGLEKILDENKEFLCTKLRASLPTAHTEYDVQENARKLLVDLKNDPIMNPVKQYVYNNPMEIETILMVGGLWLRDDFLGQPRRVAKNDDNQKGIE